MCNRTYRYKCVVCGLSCEGCSHDGFYYSKKVCGKLRCSIAVRRLTRRAVDEKRASAKLMAFSRRFSQLTHTFGGHSEKVGNVKKANDYEYEIDTAGLGGQMYFCGDSSCGHIKNGVALRLSIVRGGWVVPLSHIWQMAFIATAQAAEQSVQRIWATVREKWQSFSIRPNR